jgi:hypothetical protein
VTTDLNTLLTALYVKIDDWLGERPRPGRPPRLSDAELLTLAVAQVLRGVRSQARWPRLVPRALPAAFPYLPGQSGYNKRLRGALPLIKRLIRALASDTDLWADPVWVIDSTPVEGARSRPTVQRSNLAGWAGYGYCPSHSRFFWGLRPHLVCTPAGLPVTWALAGPKLDERQVLMAVLDEQCLRPVDERDGSYPPDHLRALKQDRRANAGREGTTRAYCSSRGVQPRR